MLLSSMFVIQQVQEENILIYILLFLTKKATTSLQKTINIAHNLSTFKETALKF